MTEKPRTEVLEIVSLLSDSRDRLLAKWHEEIHKVCAALDETLISGGRELPVSKDELGRFLDAYLEDLRGNKSVRSQQYVVELVGRKVQANCPLVFLEIINGTFADVVRGIIREQFPDSFDARANCMEWVAELVSRNDVRLAHEYETLINALNQQVLERQAELARQNEMMQEFFAAASHEFQAPLWSILGFATKVLERKTTALEHDGIHALTRIQENVRKMHLLISGFVRLLHVSPFNTELTNLPLQRVLRGAITRLHQNTSKEHAIQLDGEPYPEIHGDYRMIESLFVELLRNAVMYTNPSLDPYIRIAVDTCKDKRNCRIRVLDNGIGIPPQYVALVWKPLERLNDIRVDGLGLGLTYVKRVVEVHRGTIDIKPRPEGGTCVEILLPLAKRPDSGKRKGPAKSERGE